MRGGGGGEEGRWNLFLVRNFVVTFLGERSWYGHFFVLTTKNRTQGFIRGTQRIVSMEYLFGRPVIASNFRLGKCHLELS